MKELEKIKSEQIEVFIKRAEAIAREWTEAELEGENTHPRFANEMFDLHNLAKSTMETFKEAEEA